MDKARDATKQENAATEVESTNAASSPPRALSDSTKNEVAGDDTKAEATAEETNVNSNSTIQLRNRNVKKQKNYFYIGGGNGSYLVEENLTRLGWERIYDKNREDYKLKWCEIKANNNYHLFREGEQLVYQIPNNKLLTTKIGLLTSLQEYDRVMNKVKKGRPRIMRYQDFLPETFRLDIKDERELFFEQYVDGEVWISKPTGLNQGKGIYLIRSTEDIARIQEKMMEDDEEVQTARKLPFKIPMARIVQRYVLNPLLLDGRKFDVRNYLVIACANPLVVLYRDGYCRLTCTKYDVNSTDLTGHLTNQFMQKKNPLYEEVKEDTVWSMERFNDYINENFADEFDLQENWVNTVLKRRCQQIMLHCFQAARHKFECRLGYFDLIGCDFLIHDDFKISLLEMNCNPALHTNCDTLKDVIPDVVGETLGLALECFEKSNRREKMQPFATLHNCTLLYNGDVIEAAERRERMQSAAEARRRQRSAQRRKRFVPGQYVYRRNQNPTTNATAAATTATASAATTSAACVTSQHGSFNTVTSPRGTNVSVATSTTSLQTNGCVTSTSAINLPSSTVVAGTTASQQRVVAHSKSNSSVQVKPFYAGGTVASRPYSSPRFKPTRYAQVEPRIDTHNSLTSLDSPRRNSVNNAALVAATNSRIVSYAQKGRNELYAPKRNDAGQTGGGIKGISEEEMNDLLDDINDELGMISENLLEEIMDDEDEEGCRDEEEDEEGSGGASLRRPSARLPVSYHNMVADISRSSNRINTYGNFAASSPGNLHNATTQTSEEPSLSSSSSTSAGGNVTTSSSSSVNSSNSSSGKAAETCSKASKPKRNSPKPKSNSVDGRKTNAAVSSSRGGKKKGKAKSRERGASNVRCKSTSHIIQPNSPSAGTTNEESAKLARVALPVFKVLRCARKSQGKPRASADVTWEQARADAEFAACSKLRTERVLFRRVVRDGKLRSHRTFYSYDRKQLSTPPLEPSKEDCRTSFRLPKPTRSVSDLSTASSRVVAQINDFSVRRRVKRIASLAIRQNGVIPTTTAATDLSGGFPIGETVQISPRSSFDAAQQINKNYRAPTTVRLRQSLQATTCTLEIGPKSRRGLIAVTPGKQLLDRGENNKHRRRSQNAKLKLIKQNIFPPDDDHDVAASPPLLYNATSQMQRSMTGEGGAVGPKLQMQIPAPLPLGAAPLPLGPAPLGPAPLPLGSAHNTTTHNLLRRSEAIIPYTHHTRLVSSLVSPGHGTKPDSTVTPRRNLPPTSCSEEQVIWRLRSRATPDRIGAGQKVLLKVPVMAQSPPGLTHSPPRRFVDVVTPRQLVKNDASRKKSDLTTRLRQQVEGEAQADLTVVAQRPVVVLVGADQSVSAKPIGDESDDQRASLTFTAG